MSWCNPTQEEASESYYDARSSYYNAAYDYNSNARQLYSYQSSMSSIRNDRASCRSDKVNFQKRIEDIEEIIAAMEGSGGWFSANVPDAVDDANSSAKTAGESFSRCIVCDEVTASDLSTTFKCKSVSEDSDSAGALQSFKSEKSRLEQAVADIEKQIDSLNEQADELAKKMNSINAQQQALRKSMASSAFEMAHYKRYM